MKSHGRFSWQNKTLFDLKRESGILEYGSLSQNKADYRYVIIFGYPQTGKTEIVLSLIGIEDKYLPHVYSVLRAKQAVSHSSTASAIMYHRMINENFKWGLCKEYVGEKVKKEIKYVDEAELVQELRKIRVSVEEGKEEYYKHRIIQHIYIPAKYFKQISEDSFDVIDFPGIDSNNLEEARYVGNLAERFLPLATKVLLVCNAFRVTELQTIKIPGMENLAWSDQPHRFLVIPTYAYTGQQDACIEAFKKDPVNFTGVCLDNCRKAAMCYIQTNEQIDIAPLEMGESLRGLESGKFWHGDKMPAEFYNGIRRTNESVIKDIRNKIVNSEFYQPLQERITFQRLIKKKYDLNMKDLHEQIKTNNKLIKGENKKIADLTTVKNNKTEEFNQLEQALLEVDEVHNKIKKNNFKEKIDNSKDIIYNWLYERINTVHEYDSDYKNSELLEDLFDKEKFPRFMNIICEAQELFEKAEYSRCIYKKFAVSSELARKCRKLFKKRIPLIGCSRRDKSEVCSRIQEYVLDAVKEWHELTIKKYESDYSEEKKSCTEEKNLLQLSLEDISSQISNAEEMLKKYEDIDVKIKNQIIDEELTLKNTEEIFARWRDFAFNNFLAYRRNVIDVLNNTQNAVIKIELFLDLCVATQDFEDLMKG